MPQKRQQHFSFEENGAQPGAGVRGFTLVELIVVLSVIGIIATIAYPTMQSNLRKSKRNDAIEALIRAQIAEERWRINDTDYASYTELGSPATAEGYYTLSVPLNTATAYTLRATANGDQSNDKVGGTSCSPMEISVSAGGETRSPSVCW